MSEDNTEQELEDEDFSIYEEQKDIPIELDENLDVPQLLNSFERLGKYKSLQNESTKLGSGFSENLHTQTFQWLLERLIDFDEDFPIPVLEQMVKYFRAKKRTIEAKLLDILFQQGSTKISFLNGDEYTKDFELNVYYLDEDRTSFYQELEKNGYGFIIKTVFSFDKGTDNEKIKEVSRILLENKIMFEKNDSINGQTLKSKIREMYIKGVELDEKIVKIVPRNVLKFKNTKKQGK